MEDNTTISVTDKLKNMFSNFVQLLQADKRIAIAAIGISLLVVITFFIFISLLFRPFDSSEDALQTESSPLPQTSQRKNTQEKQKNAQATLTLVVKNPKKTTVKVGEQISIQIIGNTNKVAVRGYDALIKFDSTRVSFVTEKNLFPMMRFMRRIWGNWLMVSGTELLSAKHASVLENTPLMEVVFIATKPGTAYFPMSYIPDSFNDSNLIDTASNDILSKVRGTVLYIIP